MKGRVTGAKRRKAPNCTHINMDRIYGREQCCFDDLPSPADYNSDPGRFADPKSELRKELERIGLSESIILTAERGEYSPTQLAKIKALKLELKQAIEDAVLARAANEMHTKLAFGKGPWNHDGACNSKDLGPQACNFQACHTCRPFYKDRVYISIQAVLSNDFAPLTPADAALLPMKPASKLRSIGLQPNPAPPTHTVSPSTVPTSTNLTSSRASVVTFQTTQTDIDDLSAMRLPLRRFYNLGHRSSQDVTRDLSKSRGPPGFRGLKSAIQGIFRPSRESSSSGSAISLPLPRTGTARDLSKGDAIREFDVGTLRRVRRQKDRHDQKNGRNADQIERSKPEEITTHVEGGKEVAEDLDSDSDCTVYSCVSEGSEVEVDGGVALTEEAVQTHTPDILTIPAEKILSLEDAEESIMAQV